MEDLFYIKRLIAVFGIGEPVGPVAEEENDGDDAGQDEEDAGEDLFLLAEFGGILIDCCFGVSF
jgi:hypothetical protein